MLLNNLKPASGSSKGNKVGFEGGQMPLQRRLPKRGFRSRQNGMVAQVRTSELNILSGIPEIDLSVLKEHNLIPSTAVLAKVFLSGDVLTALTLKGIAVTMGAKKIIEAAGGSISE